MMLLVLGVILMVAVLLMLLVGAGMVVLLVRYWNLVRPIAFACLLLLGGVAFFDALAATRAVHCAEAGKTGALTTATELAPASTDASAAPAPEWTRRRPGEMDTTQDVVEVTVHAGPCLSRADCEVELAKELIRVVDDYMRSEIATTSGAAVQVTPRFIEEQLVQETYVAHSKREVVSSLGPQDMIDLYALVKIDRDGRNQLRDLWRESVVQHRMTRAGGALAAILAVLTLGWAMLRRPPKPGSVDVGKRAS